MRCVQVPGLALVLARGQIHFELNMGNNTVEPHRIRAIENGRVEELCVFGRRVVTSIKSLR